jgi:hypothetical protein
MTEDDFKEIRHCATVIKSKLHGLSTKRQTELKDLLREIVIICDRNIGIDSHEG